MKKSIALHDFCGHPFTYELAKEFNKNSIKLDYIFTSDDKGPKAILDYKYKIDINLTMGEEIPKKKPLKRFFWEFKYFIKLNKLLNQKKYDTVIFSNTPILILFFLCIFNHNFKMVWWVQDIFSEAALNLKILPRLLRVFVYFIFKAIEFFISLRAKKIIIISKDFLEFIPSKFAHKVSFIENWPAKANYKIKKNIKKNRIVYSGTVGFKHGKEKIINFAKNALDKGFEFSLISEGDNAKYIEQSLLGFKNFKRLNFMNYHDLTSYISNSKAGVFVLDDEASTVSIPSKVYTYLICNIPVFGICPTKHHLAKFINDKNLGAINDESFFFDMLENSLKYNNVIKSINKINEDFKVENKFNKFKKIIL